MTPVHVTRRAGLASSLVEQRPRGARGILPLIMAAMGAGRAIYGAVDANQKKQKNKGYIQKNYELASKRLTTNQTNVGQQQYESEAARGLTGGGDVSAIRAAMVGSGAPAAGGTPHTLGAQLNADTAGQFQLERTDLENQRERAETENNDQYKSSLISSVMSGANMAAQAASGGADLSAMSSGGGGGIRSAMVPQASMTGIDDPANAWGGIHPVSPLTAPGSSWNRNASGESNADFNING